MKLNRVERALMNNPVRAALQRAYEARLLARLGGQTPGAYALEVGCGRGVGTEIVLERFRAARVEAFDFDEEMVGRAQARLADYGDRARVFAGDVTNIPFEDGTFGAVFDFGTIHHVPNWREAIAEISRVLRPDGRFFFEEVTSHALARWSYRTFLDHPVHDRFSSRTFIAELERHGLFVGDRYVERFFGDFLIGVAQKGYAGVRVGVAS